MRIISIFLMSSVLLFSCAGRILSNDTEANADQPGSLSGTVVASGDFQGYGHLGNGRAQVVEGEDGGSVLLKDFQTTPGPDLFVYLATGLDAADYVDLGELAQPTGDQSYSFPGPVNTDRYRYVLIWCKSYSVLFAAAELE